MRVSAEAQYKGGDYYPGVRSWMVKLDAVALDQKANATYLNEQECRIYVAALLSEHFDVRFRRMQSEGRGWHKYITLNRDTLDAGSMSLGTVLHEIAHAITHQRYHEKKQLRNARIRADRKIGIWKPRDVVRRLDFCGHGEVFCRTYARLLRETMT